jgi:hypothetical protein
MALNKKNQEASVVEEAAEAAAVHATEVVAQEGEVLEAEPEVVEVTASVPAVASQPQTQLTVPTSHAGIGVSAEIANALAEQGFAPLTFDYHSFVNIKLQSEFEGPEGVILPSDGFYVSLTSSRPKWAATSKHVNDKEREAVFVYDKRDLVDPNSKLYEAVQRWKEQGVGWEWKDYLDVYCTMLHDGLGEKSFEGQFCVLSLPRTSIGKFNVFISSLTAKYKMPLKDLVVKVLRGPKITDAVKPYYPWKFESAGKLADWSAPE